MSREQDRLTRRDVLRGAAVAGAVALVDPGVGFAKARPASVFSQFVGALAAGVTAPIAAPRPFSLVGVEWSAPDRARVELRTRAAGGGWGPWATASVQGHEPDHPPTSDRRFGEAVWVGAADELQLRSPGRVEGVRLHLVTAGVGAGGGGAVAGGVGAGGLGVGAGGLGAGGAHMVQAWPLAQPVLDAGAGQPPIIARAAWAHGHAPPRHTPEYGTIKLAFVHHSETPNGYGASQVPAILYSIFAYHRYVRDYFDIAYNFAVDAYGRIWEARAGGIDLPVMGAHAGGYNLESTGVVVLGTFTGTSPSPAALGALEQLLAWKLSLHGVPALGRAEVVVAPDAAAFTAFAPGAHVSLPRIAGHRDGDQTSCPGDVLYGELPSIRPRVAQLAGSAARLTISAPATVTSPGSTVALAGRLAQLASGAPFGGATIELQQIGPHGGASTVATATTGADGSWNATVTAAQNTLLRALHRSSPAATSDVVAIAVAPALTVTLASTSPLIVSGSVAPAGLRVTIDLYRVLGPARRRLVASKRLAAAGGSFHTRLKRPRPGRYVVIARTGPSARFAAGASPAVSLMV